MNIILTKVCVKLSFLRNEFVANQVNSRRQNEINQQKGGKHGMKPETKYFPKKALKKPVAKLFFKIS